MTLRRGHRSMFTWQVDHAVRKPQRDFVERKIGELNKLGIDGVVVAIFADERSSVDTQSGY
jgi:hypothetical protein